MNQSERDLFEAWAKKNRYHLRRDGDEYHWLATRDAWFAWQACATAQSSRIARLEEALRWCIKKIDAEICTHEETYRGGSIWTICDSCGMKWADDRGGFKPYQEPSELTAARAALKGEA